MNKKADERVLSIYLFIIYIIVAIGIVAGVLIYTSPGDIRKLEAGILSNKVIDCLAEQGELNSEVLNPNFNLMSSCNLDFKDNTEKFKGDEQYTVKVELYDFNSCNRVGGKLYSVECTHKIKEEEIYGKQDFLSYCEISGKKIPVCDVREVYVLNGNARVLLRVTGIVGKV